MNAAIMSDCEGQTTQLEPDFTSPELSFKICNLLAWKSCS